MQHKNDYSVIVFLANKEVKKWAYIHKIDHFVKTCLQRKFPNWEYMNIYDRRSRDFIKRVMKGEHIPSFLNE